MDDVGSCSLSPRHLCIVFKLPLPVNSNQTDSYICMPELFSGLHTARCQIVQKVHIA